LAFWRWRAGDAPPRLDGLAEPYALQIDGDWRAAADGWHQLACPYEEARALADGDDAARRDALDIFLRLGARGAANQLARELRAVGLGPVPRGPFPTTRANPFGLTARQIDILALIGDDLTNAEIAAQLGISPKTVDHHVGAILAKLDVHSRKAAAGIARQVDLARQK
jgi:DNA-binding CsgD family transcriptional regulator